jgi:hypothetical protein
MEATKASSATDMHPTEAWVKATADAAAKSPTASAAHVKDSTSTAATATPAKKGHGVSSE